MCKLHLSDFKMIRVFRGEIKWGESTCQHTIWITWWENKNSTLVVFLIWMTVSDSSSGRNELPISLSYLVWRLKFNENSFEICRLILRKSNSFHAISGCHSLSSPRNRSWKYFKNCFLPLSLPTSKKCIRMRAAHQSRLLFFIEQVKNCFLVLSLPLKWPFA